MLDSRQINFEVRFAFIAPKDAVLDCEPRGSAASLLRVCHRNWDWIHCARLLKVIKQVFSSAVQAELCYT